MSKSIVQVLIKDGRAEIVVRGSELSLRQYATALGSAVRIIAAMFSTPLAVSEVELRREIISIAAEEAEQETLPIVGGTLQ